MKLMYVFIISLSSLALGILLGRSSVMVPSDSHSAEEQNRNQTAIRSLTLGDQSAQAMMDSFDETRNPRTEEQLREDFREIMEEPNWVKKKAAFHLMLATADLSEVQTMYKVLGEYFSMGWVTNDLHMRVKYREGMLMGESGMDNLPTEPNGSPEFEMKERMLGWATGDPEACLKWLGTLEPGSVKDELTAQWINGMRHADPNKVQKLFGGLKPDHQHQMVMALVGGVVQQRGLVGMGKWYQTIQKDMRGDVKEYAFKTVIDHFTQNKTDWRAAVDFVKQASEPEGKLFATGLQQLVWRTSPYALGETLDLLDQYAPRNEHLAKQSDDYIKNAIKGASNESAFVVGEWLDENKNSKIYNDVTMHYVNYVKDLDSEAAKTWAESITDQKLREKVIADLKDDK